MSKIFASNQARYRELVEVAQANELLWIAESEGVALILANESGEELILVWPTAESVSAVTSSRPNLAHYLPSPRPLDRWLRSSTPHLTEDGILVAASPDADLNCLRVPADSFAKDLAARPRLQSKDLTRLRRTVARRKRGEA